MTSTNTLIGLDLTGSESLSTLPVSLNIIASLLLTIPASFFMARFGRRSGFLLGILFGLVGTSLVILGLQKAL